MQKLKIKEMNEAEKIETRMSGTNNKKSLLEGHRYKRATRVGTLVTSNPINTAHN